MEMIKYAIVDGAIESDLVNFLKETIPPHCCLYAEPVQPELVALAPYLVVVTEEVNTWLNEKTTPWGIYFKSDLSLRELQQHFRRYLWVMIPEQTKPVLMRFYDPRNIWALAAVLTPRQLNLFLKPVSQVSSSYDGIYHEDNFSEVRVPDDNNAKLVPFTMLSLNYRQYQQLEQQAHKNYLDKLSTFIIENNENTDLITSENNKAAINLAEEYFLYCQSLNITDDHSIRIMTMLMLRKNISDTNDIPDSWNELLSNKSYPEHYRVQQLALGELGFIPQ